MSLVDRINDPKMKKSEGIISVRNLSFAYPNKQVLSDVSFSVECGQFLGIVGPNGAGKTTLLRCMAGFLKPSHGRVLFGGYDERDIASLKRNEIAGIMAVVPQDTQIQFDFTVEEFVAMGRMPHLSKFERETAKDREIVMRALEATGLTGSLNRLVTTLSGGERQRAVIARALAQEPIILLLDEPTAHLDIGYQVEIMDLIRMSSQSRTTMVGVFHDLNLASIYCDRILMLKDGTVNSYGTPEEVFTQKRLADLYRKSVFVTGHPVHKKPLMAPYSSIQSGTDVAEKNSNGKMILVTGGARSGKSTFAERLAAGIGDKVLYVATCEALDDEMRARVEMHKRRRCKSWLTIEEPLEATSVMNAAIGKYDAILIDCLGIFVSNHLLKQDENMSDAIKTENVLKEVTKLAEAAAAAAKAGAQVVAVTNEAGSGIVPAYHLGRLFRDIIGWANQIFADLADNVYLCVSGIPLNIKSTVNNAADNEEINCILSATEVRPKI